MPDIGVVYLCRFAEGEGPVRTFLQSYRGCPAGLDHDLYVMFKGFPDRRSLASWRALFGDIPFDAMIVDDTGYDIGSYVSAAANVSNRRLVFLNTFSQILEKDWLQHFDLALSVPGVGVVGATGSWQAGASRHERAVKTIAYNIRHLPVYLRKRASGSSRSGADVGTWPKRPFRRYLFFPCYYIADLYEYGRHPNPHVRTNAFMIERERFLALRRPTFTSKRSVLKFESGRRSLTRQIMAQGLRPVVVDRTGAAHDASNWNASRTFHAGGQQNLMIADQRTREYTVASPEFRRFLEAQAWADPWLWQP